MCAYIYMYIIRTKLERGYWWGQMMHFYEKSVMHVKTPNILSMICCSNLGTHLTIPSPTCEFFMSKKVYKR